jgi:hypothetical protein
MPPRTFKHGPDDARWVVTHFKLKEFQLQALRTASSFGARHSRPPGVFLGLQYQLEDNKLADLIEGCEAPAQLNRRDMSRSNQPAPDRQQSGLSLLDKPIILPDTDFYGGDYDTKGAKGIGRKKCLQRCLSIESCRGFTWVERNAWCWPKHTLGRKSPRPGIVSVIVRQ